MFLHLGDGIMVPLEDVIFIGDYALLTETEAGRQFFAALQQDRRVIKALPQRLRAGMKIKSMIQTKDCLYLSLISPLTLKKRAEQPLTSLGLALA